MTSIRVEFYGVPRARAGRAEVEVDAATLADALRAVEHVCPALAPLFDPDGRPSRHYLVCLDGARFTEDREAALLPGTRLVLLSADAGG